MTTAKRDEAGEASETSDRSPSSRAQATENDRATSSGTATSSAGAVHAEAVSDEDGVGSGSVITDSRAVSGRVEGENEVVLRWYVSSVRAALPPESFRAGDAPAIETALAVADAIEAVLRVLDDGSGLEARHRAVLNARVMSDGGYWGRVDAHDVAGVSATAEGQIKQAVVGLLAELDSREQSAGCGVDANPLADIDVDSTRESGSRGLEASGARARLARAGRETSEDLRRLTDELSLREQGAGAGRVCGDTDDSVGHLVVLRSMAMRMLDDGRYEAARALVHALGRRCGLVAVDGEDDRSREVIGTYHERVIAGDTKQDVDHVGSGLAVSLRWLLAELDSCEQDARGTGDDAKLSPREQDAGAHAMRDEHDFSTAVRGKFYRPGRMVRMPSVDSARESGSWEHKQELGSRERDAGLLHDGSPAARDEIRMRVIHVSLHASTGIAMDHLHRLRAVADAGEQTSLSLAIGAGLAVLRLREMLLLSERAKRELVTYADACGATGGDVELGSSIDVLLEWLGVRGDDDSTRESGSRGVEVADASVGLNADLAVPTVELSARADAVARLKVAGVLMTPGGDRTPLELGSREQDTRVDRVFAYFVRESGSRVLVSDSVARLHTQKLGRLLVHCIDEDRLEFARELAHVMTGLRDDVGAGWVPEYLEEAESGQRDISDDDACVGGGLVSSLRWLLKRDGALVDIQNLDSHEKNASVGQQTGRLTPREPVGRTPLDNAQSASTSVSRDADDWISQDEAAISSARGELVSLGIPPDVVDAAINWVSEHDGDSRRVLDWARSIVASHSARASRARDAEREETSPPEAIVLDPDIYPDDENKLGRREQGVGKTGIVIQDSQSIDEKQAELSSREQDAGTKRSSARSADWSPVAPDGESAAGHINFASGVRVIGGPFEELNPREQGVVAGRFVHLQCGDSVDNSAGESLLPDSAQDRSSAGTVDYAGRLIAEIPKLSGVNRSYAESLIYAIRHLQETACDFCDLGLTWRGGNLTIEFFFDYRRVVFFLDRNEDNSCWFIASSPPSLVDGSGLLGVISDRMPAVPLAVLDRAMSDRSSSSARESESREQAVRGIGRPSVSDDDRAAVDRWLVGVPHNPVSSAIRSAFSILDGRIPESDRHALERWISDICSVNCGDEVDRIVRAVRATLTEIDMRRFAPMPVPAPDPDSQGHLVGGEFQSDKYPTTPRGKVPLSVRDRSAQDLLWEYAQRRRAVDDGFSQDLESALRAAGYEPGLSEVDVMMARDGFHRIGRLDHEKRRSIWFRFDERAIEIRAGREGGDLFVRIERDDRFFATMAEIVDSARFSAEWEDSRGRALEESYRLGGHPWTSAGGPCDPW